jgi:hypothetical protein
MTRKTLADWARPASDYMFFCVYRPSIIVATARRANPRNNSQKLIEPKAIKLPKKPTTPRTTAIHHVMFFGADSFIVILLFSQL